MSQGLKFRKVDLHVHTPASKCFIDQYVTPEDFVKAAIDVGLDAIAITDHNTGDWIDKIKEAAKDTPLTVFPGIEITVAPGIHIIAIFDIDKNASHVTHLLGALKIDPEKQGTSKAICDKHSLSEVMNLIKENKGLAILPHIDAPCGAYTVLSGLSGNALTNLFNEGDYIAVETLSGDLPEGYTKNKGFTNFPPSYQASDNPSPDDHKKHSLKGIGNKYSQFKFDKEINLEGLRQCFSDSEVRIKKMDVTEESKFPRILELRVSDGFLKYQNIKFHNGLNSIIGGKGTGKSLIVEFLRFALDQISDNTAIQEDIKLKLEKRLGINNYIELICELPSGTQYKIKKTYKEELHGEYECIKLTSNELYNGSISEIFPILAYSQTEVIKISENEEAQLKLIDTFIDKNTYIKSIDKVKDLLKENDYKYVNSKDAFEKVTKLEKEFDTLKAQVEEIHRALQGDGNEAKIIEEYELYDNKRKFFKKQENHINNIIEIITKSYKEIDNLSPIEIEKKFELDEDINKIDRKFSQLKENLLLNLNKSETDINSIKNEILAIIQNWEPHYKEKEEIYLQLVKKNEIREQCDNKRKIFMKQMEDLTNQINSEKALSVCFEDIKTERNKLLDELEETYKTYYEARKNMFNELTRKSNNRLKLILEYSKNAEALKKQLSLLARGSHASPTDYQNIVSKISPRKFVEIILSNDIKYLIEQAHISETISKNIINKLAQNTIDILNLQYNYHPEDVPSIMLFKDDGEYAPLKELSIGQKSIALLIIALSQGTYPVIIDQPEDALDVTTVWEDISKKLRKNKDKRQFILTTHNPTVAVSSDSDMFVIVRGKSDRGKVQCCGAIDEPKAKKAIIQHLEGGEEPYFLRAKKYNLKGG